MKTFVFDAEGVVCVGKAFSTALEKQRRIPRDRLSAFFGGPFHDCLLGRRDLKEEVVPYLSVWGWPESVDDLLAFWFQCEHVVCSKIITCVRALRQRGHLCVLGTNQEKYRAAYLWREMRLAEEFDHLFPSCELGAAKPPAAFFEGVQHRLGLSPRSLCLIDDADRNVFGAKTFGWSAIHYRGTADIAAIEKEAHEAPQPVRMLVTDPTGTRPSPGPRGPNL